jgi:hypothetical protein
MSKITFNKAEKYSQSKVHQVVVNNGGKILIAAITLIYLVHHLFDKNPTNINRLHHVVVGLIIAFILINILIKRFAYEIEINHVSSLMTFRLYRTNIALYANKKDVSFSKKYGYLIFRVGSGFIVYNGEISDKLMESLTRFLETASPNQGSARAESLSE